MEQVTCLLKKQKASMKWIFLPDIWLRRVDMSFTIFAVCATWYYSNRFTHINSDVFIWGGTALVCGMLWLTNGTAYMLNKIREITPVIVLWLLLSF